MQNSAKELEICQKLKPLENQIFNTKTALFDALADAGVQLTKGYRTGSNNKKGAEKYSAPKRLIMMDDSIRVLFSPRNLFSPISLNLFQPF